MRESAQPAIVIATAASTTVRRMQCDERFKAIPRTNRPFQSPALMPRYGVRKANGSRQGGPCCPPVTSQIGEGSGVFTPNPSFLEHQPACKPGFVGHRRLAQAIRDGHSSGTMFAHCLEQPTRTASLTTPCGVIALRRTSRVAVPIRSCSRCGLPCRFRCRTRGALLPHLFTLTTPTPRREKASGSFSVALSLGSPPPDVIRHRLSMEPGLSSPATFR